MLVVSNHGMAAYMHYPSSSSLLTYEETGGRDGNLLNATRSVSELQFFTTELNQHVSGILYTSTVCWALYVLYIILSYYFHSLIWQILKSR